MKSDANRRGIGIVLLQEGKPIAYLSEKLNGSKLNYSTNDKEFYVIVRALENWTHYLGVQAFILYSDCESPWHING